MTAELLIRAVLGGAGAISAGLALVHMITKYWGNSIDGKHTDNRQIESAVGEDSR